VERAWQATLLDLQRHVDEAFDRLVFRPWAVAPRPCWQPYLDQHETAEGYVLEIDLPGVPPADVQIVVSEQAVTISGRREASAPEGMLQSRCERPVGPFRRSVSFSHPIVPGDTKAEYRHGTYRLLLSKAPGRETSVPQSSCLIQVAVG
jgi:HSP20 family protein